MTTITQSTLTIFARTRRVICLLTIFAVMSNAVRYSKDEVKGFTNFLNERGFKLGGCLGGFEGMNACTYACTSKGKIEWAVKIIDIRTASLLPDTFVVIDGLVNAKQYNGKHAQIKEWDNESSRWIVTDDITGKNETFTLRLQPKNLKLDVPKLTAALCQHVNESISNEIALQMTMDHKHIIKIKQHFGSEAMFKTKFPKYQFVIMERGYGDLGDLMISGKPLPENTVAQYTRQLAEALEHMHDKGVMHRDIKPENIVLMKDGLGVKITDFGHAKFARTTKGVRGTYMYQAFEMSAKMRYDAKVDMWSLGVCVYVMLIAQYPWEFNSRTGGYHQLGGIEWPWVTMANSKVSPEANEAVWNLINLRQCLEHQTNSWKNARWSPKELLESQWLQHAVEPRRRLTSKRDRIVLLRLLKKVDAAKRA